VSFTVWGRILRKAHGGLEHAARGGGVFAEEDDALVAPHFLRDPGGDRVPVAQLRHALPPSAHTSVIADRAQAWASLCRFRRPIELRHRFGLDFASFASGMPAASSLPR